MVLTVSISGGYRVSIHYHREMDRRAAYQRSTTYNEHRYVIVCYRCSTWKDCSWSEQVAGNIASVAEVIRYRDGL